MGLETPDFCVYFKNTVESVKKIYQTGSVEWRDAVKLQYEESRIHCLCSFLL